MKKTLILVFALVALCLLASCDPNKNTEKKVITNLTGSLSKTFTSEKEGYYKRHIKLVSNEVTLKEWLWDNNEKKWDEEPYIYEGAYSYSYYDKLVEETSTKIEKTRTPCYELRFTTLTAPEGTDSNTVNNYKINLDNYSGLFDVEYVSGYTTNSEGWGYLGGWVRGCDRETVVNFTITLSESAPKNTLLMGEWTCEI